MALLTPILEDLIWKGKASYKTTCIGLSGYNLLQIPKHSIAVILDFTYFHFIDCPAEQDGVIEFLSEFEDYMTSSVHQIRFESKRSSNHYMIKEPACMYKFGQGAQGKDIVCVNGHVQFQCYQIHEDDVRIELAKVKGNGLITNARAPAGSNFKEPPAGYGTQATTNAVTNVYSCIIPLGAMAVTAGYFTYLVPLATKQLETYYFNRLEFPYTNDTKLTIAPFESWLWRYAPIVDINYVLINELPKNLRGV